MLIFLSAKVLLVLKMSKSNELFFNEMFHLMLLILELRKHIKKDSKKLSLFIVFMITDLSVDDIIGHCGMVN
jgi:hypothetical protein